MPHPNDTPTRAMRAYLWDLADEGIDNVLARLSENGVDGLHLSLLGPGGRFYCPHNPKRLLVHAPEGTVYFNPTLSGYGRLRPPVHPEYGSGQFASRVREALRDEGMTLTAGLGIFYNLPVSLAYPDCTVRTALGDLLQGTLCPANPAVRTYAQGLVEDLAYQVDADAIELHDFSFLSHEAYSGPRRWGIPLGRNLGYLMSLCFCPHCRARAEEANIEVDDLEHHVERMIRAGLSGDLSERRIGDEISDPYHPVGRYAMVRSETVGSLLDELVDTTQGSHAQLQPVLTEEPDESWRWGIELHALRQRVPRVTLVPPEGRIASTPFVERYVELLQMGHDMAVDIHLMGQPEAPEEEAAWTQTMDACAQAGTDRFIFSHYGLAPLDALEWIGGLARRR